MNNLVPLEYVLKIPSRINNELHRIITTEVHDDNRGFLWFLTIHVWLNFTVTFFVTIFVYLHLSIRKFASRNI